MVKLYELSAEIRDLERMLMDEECDQDSFLAALDATKQERDAKIANSGLLIKEFRKDKEVRADEIKRLQSLNKTTDARIKWLTDYICAHLVGKVKTPLISVSPLKGRESLRVDDDAQLPDRFYRRELDKTELKKAVNDGEEYHGVRLERGPGTVMIR